MRKSAITRSLRETLRAVDTPRPPGTLRGRSGHGVELQAKAEQDGAGRSVVAERGAHFCPHDVAGEKRSLSVRVLEGQPGGFAEFLVAGKYVQQDGRVDRGSHRRPGRGPLISSRVASTPFGSRKIP